MKLSGFTFIHNAIDNGLPVFEAVAQVQPFVDEMVVIDMGSTDRTGELLSKQGHKVIRKPWLPSRDLLNQYFSDHSLYCTGDIIIFFEGDEVFDTSLLNEVRRVIDTGVNNVAVYRLQVGQNFQRCRWYPISIHRVFPRGGGSYAAHPVLHPPMYEIQPEYGFVWDCSNCFRDNLENRRKTADQLWGQPRRLFVRNHFLDPVELSEDEERDMLNELHWTWKATPFAIPDILKQHLGKTKYEPMLPG